MAIDETIRLQMDQNFATHHKRMNDHSAQFDKVAGFIDQQSQYQFLHESRLVGAAAAGNLSNGGLPAGVLAHRAAAGQPGNAPSGATQ